MPDTSDFLTRGQLTKSPENVTCGDVSNVDETLDYSIDLQKIIESICYGREIAKPKTGAFYHYNMAVEYQRALAQQQPVNDLKTVRDALENDLDVVRKHINSQPNFSIEAHDALARISATLSSMIETPTPTEKVDVNAIKIEILTKEEYRGAMFGVIKTVEDVIDHLATRYDFVKKED